MPKRKGGGYRPPKNYVPGGRGAAPGRRMRGGAGDGGRGGADDGGRGVTTGGGGRGAAGVETPRGDRARRAAARATRRDAAAPSLGRPSAPRRDPAARGTPAQSRGEAHRHDPSTGRDTFGRNTADRDHAGRGSGERHDRADRPGLRTPSRHEDVVHARLEATATSAAEVEGLTFAELGLGARIVEALEELGAVAPFPIQAATIPDALAGRDVLGRGRTGSGKTIAFGAALVERLLLTRPQAERGKRRVEGRPPRGLIIAPTRELALQIDRTVQPIARRVGMFTTQVYGGVPQQRQVGALRRGVDIVIGTPGRIEDLQRQGHLDLSRVAVTVLDEADQMCDLGFLEPMQRILRSVAPRGQRLLFSATLDAAVMRLVTEFLDAPAVHEVAGEDADHADIDHRVLVVERDDRVAVLRQLAAAGGRVLVFTRTKLGAEQVAAELAERGVEAEALHGDLTQIARKRSLDRFARGRVGVLVATDVAARGIHVDDVRLVVQADAPDEYKTYLHRAGRTGRAGKRGMVVTLIAPGRRRRMSELLERAGIDAAMLPARPGGRELDEFAAPDARA